MLAYKVCNMVRPDMSEDIFPVNPLIVMFLIDDQLKARTN